MRDVKEILVDYNIALMSNDMLEMAELIKEMKETDPVFVDLMLNAVNEDEEEEE